MMTWKLKSRICLLAAFILISGCSEPIVRASGTLVGDHLLKSGVGIGPGATDLKQSPCACIPIPLLGPDSENPIL